MGTQWRRFTKRYILPYIRFHDLRHTSATLLINKGVHMKTISARLGHSKIGITMDTYGYHSLEADQTAVRHFDELLD